MDIKADKVQNSVGQMCPMPIAFLAKNMRHGFVRYFVKKTA